MGYFSSDDFIELLNTKKCFFNVQLRSVRVVGPISYTSSSDELVWVRCRVSTDEPNDYDYNEKYKVTMKPEEDGFGKRSYYVYDFVSMINDGDAEMFVED